MRSSPTIRASRISITAYISLVFGTDSTERWAGYLLFALFPVSVYAGSRLLGWSPWAAGIRSTGLSACW